MSGTRPSSPNSELRNPLLADHSTSSTTDESSDLERKHQAPEVSPHSFNAVSYRYVSANQQSLIYFAAFEKEEREEFLAEINKDYGSDNKQYTLQDLDNRVADNHKKYLAYRALLYFYLATDTSYSWFQVSTSNDGIQGPVDMVVPGTKVSNTVGYSIGGALAFGDWFFNMLQFDAHKEAVKATIKHLLNPSYWKQFQAYTNLWYDNPEKAAFTLVHRGIILTHNLTGAAANITELFDDIHNVSPYLAYGAAGVTLAAGHGYYDLQMSPMYYTGLEFWKNQTTPRPWMIGEMLRGNFAVPTQLFIQGTISTVGLRAFPGFYYLAQAAAEKFGWWLNPTATAIFVAIHTFAVRYPKSYDYFNGARAKFKALLKEEGIQDEKEIARITQDYQERIKKEVGTLSLVKMEPWMLLPIVYQAAVGTYGGYQMALLLTATLNPALAISLQAGSAALGTAVLGGLAYRAEDIRATNNKIVTLYKADQGKEKAEQGEENKPKSEETRRTGLLKFLSISIVSTSMIGRALSSTGSGKRVFGDSQVGVSATALASFHQSFNGGLSFFNNVRSTLASKSCFRPKKPSVSLDEEIVFRGDDENPSTQSFAGVETDPASNNVDFGALTANGLKEEEVCSSRCAIL